MFGFGAPLTFLIIVIALIISGIKILKEYERAVVFRLGRMVGARGPGITYIIPGVEKMVKMDLRTVTMTRIYYDYRAMTGKLKKISI